MSDDLPTIGSLLRQRALDRADKPFLIFENERRSYAELHREAETIARAMIALGLQPGDHIAVLMPNSIAAAAVFYAAHLAGAVAVPINARFKRRELSHVVTHSDARFLFTTQKVREHVDFVELVWDSIPGLADQRPGEALALQSAPSLRHIIVEGGTAPEPALSWDDLLARADEVQPSAVAARTGTVSASTTAFLLYTSGTTAAPKGCELTHEAVIRSWSAYADVVGLDGETGVWTPCPFFHIGGIGPMTAALVHGAQLLSMSYFEPEAAVAMLLEHRPRHLFPAFPPLTLGLLRTHSYHREDFRFVETAVNVAPPETQRLIQSLLPDTTALLNDFGMTEGSGIITMTWPEDPPDQRLTSNGRPLPGIEVQVIDPESRQPVPVGHEGEIRFRGVNAFKSYYKDPAATSATIDGQGWVATGDLGRVDEHGCLHFIGRIKDILKVGGENVAPAEVEAHLSTHPSVKMAQVVGKPDSKYGEVAVAFVELLPGASATGEELIDHCRGQLASFKIPREVRFVAEWPMSATKIQKFRLREELLAGA